jgi:hypothetical protein
VLENNRKYTKKRVMFSSLLISLYWFFCSKLVKHISMAAPPFSLFQRRHAMLLWRLYGVLRIIQKICERDCMFLSSAHIFIAQILVSLLKIPFQRAMCTLWTELDLFRILNVSGCPSSFCLSLAVSSKIFSRKISCAIFCLDQNTYSGIKCLHSFLAWRFSIYIFVICYLATSSLSDLFLLWIQNNYKAISCSLCLTSMRVADSKHLKTIFSASTPKAVLRSLRS